MSSKNSFISPRVLYSEVRRSPRATRPARPCGTVRQKKVCRCWDEYRRGFVGPWFPNVNLYLYTEKGRKKKGGWRRGHLDMTMREVSRDSRETLRKRDERAGERQTKTYNGHNARWSTLEFSQGRRPLHSTRATRAFAKITSSGCLFAFSYLEDEPPSSTSNSIYSVTVRMDIFLIKIVTLNLGLSVSFYQNLV